MKTECKFGTYNPIINFVFFIGAIVLGMLLMHPFFLLCSVLLSAIFLLSVKGRKGIKTILILIPVFIVIAALNPLFNTMGETVLFTYFGRPYTLEALFYGLETAAMVVSILLWFSSYNVIMTSDKFLYIFANIIPSISIILTMVLRLVPNYRNKISQIINARKSIGKAGSSDDMKTELQNGVTVLSTLTSWALEGGITTADSMRSRGFGTGKRTTFSIYKFGMSDIVLIVLMTVLLVVVSICGFNNGMSASFIPTIEIATLKNKYTLLGLIAYTLFLAIPFILNVKEDITWRILRLKI